MSAADLYEGRTPRSLRVTHEDCNGQTYCSCGEEPVESVDDANLVCSDVPFTDGKLHRPVIDLDFECKLLPSATPGHYHLYLDRAVTTGQFDAVLIAMAEAGLVERGYASSFRNRGYTAVRHPDHPKEIEK